MSWCWDWCRWLNERYLHPPCSMNTVTWFWLCFFSKSKICFLSGVLDASFSASFFTTFLRWRVDDSSFSMTSTRSRSHEPWDTSWSRKPYSSSIIFFSLPRWFFTTSLKLMSSVCCSAQNKQTMLRLRQHEQRWFHTRMFSGKNTRLTSGVTLASA